MAHRDKLKLSMVDCFANITHVVQYLPFRGQKYMSVFHGNVDMM